MSQYTFLLLHCSTSRTQEMVIGGLVEYTMYDFTVQGESKNLRGPLSTDVRCRTLEGYPSQPMRLRATLKEHTAVTLNWEPPAKANGVINRYIISYTDKSQKWNNTSVNGSTTAFDVKGLKNNTEYIFQVKAVTSAGEGPFADAWVKTEPEGNSNHPTPEPGKKLICQIRCLNRI